MRVRLKQAIVIPAGTILDDAPRQVDMAPGHVEHILGLTADSSGSLRYFIDPDDPELDEWFEILEDQGRFFLGNDEWRRQAPGMYGTRVSP